MNEWNECTDCTAAILKYNIFTTGGYNATGAGFDVWDNATNQYPQLITDGSNGNVASDSYTFWRKDVQVAKKLGVRKDQPHFLSIKIYLTRVFFSVGLLYSRCIVGKNLAQSQAERTKCGSSQILQRLN